MHTHTHTHTKQKAKQGNFYHLDQGSQNYGPWATSGPRCDFIRPAKEQIIITAGVVLIATFALKTTYAQFCSNCLLSLIYDNLFSRAYT
jgi:hypothetical protein